MGQVVAKTRDPSNDVVQRNLKKFRKDAKLTTETVAAFCDLSIDSLRRYEAGGSGVPADTLRRLANIYGHAMEHFYLEEPPPPDFSRRVNHKLMSLDGAALPEDVHAKIQKLIDEASSPEAREKKTKRK